MPAGCLHTAKLSNLRVCMCSQVVVLTTGGVQVAEGVATAGSVVNLAKQFRVSLPVLTAVASVLDDSVSAVTAVQEVINLPQLDEN